jgi:hypothetical protein
MAMEQLNLMLDHCFTKKEHKDGEAVHTVYTPVNLTMEITRPVVVPGAPVQPKTVEHDAVEATETSFQSVTTTFTLPLLTLLPLSSLAMNGIDINIDLKNVYGAEGKDLLVSDSPADEKMYLQQCTMTIHAGQLPLPAGVSTIIQAFTYSIQPIQSTDVK